MISNEFLKDFVLYCLVFKSGKLLLIVVFGKMKLNGVLFIDFVNMNYELVISRKFV